MRFIQWILGKNNTGIASFLGCIGNDYFGKMMEKKAKSDGVKVLYVIDENGRATVSNCFPFYNKHTTSLWFRFAVDQTKSIRIAIDLSARP